MPFVKLQSKQIFGSLLILLSSDRFLAIFWVMAYSLSVGRHRDGLIIFLQHFSTPRMRESFIKWTPRIRQMLHTA